MSPLDRLIRRNRFYVTCDLKRSGGFYRFSGQGLEQSERIRARPDRPPNAGRPSTDSVPTSQTDGLSAELPDSRAAVGHGQSKMLACKKSGQSTALQDITPGRGQTIARWFSW
jgi:hypothetical protein